MSEDVHILNKYDVDTYQILKEDKVVAFVQAYANGSWHTYNAEKDLKIIGTYGKTPQESFKKWKIKESKKEIGKPTDPSLSEELTETHAIYDSSSKRIISKHQDAEGAVGACRATNFANWNRNAVVDRYKIVELPKLPSYLGKPAKGPTKK